MSKSKLSFDFKKAVADFRSAYPGIAQKTFFLDLTEDTKSQLDNGDNAALLKSVAKTMTERNAKAPQKGGITQWLGTLGQKSPKDLLRQELTKWASLYSKGSASMASRSQLNDFNALFIHKTNQAGQNLFSKDQAANEEFFFMHESGHIVIPGALGNLKKEDGGLIISPQVFSECAADAFAMISWLQKHGYKGPDIDLEELGYNRAHDTLFPLKDATGDAPNAIRHFTHYTTPVLDHILIDAKTADFSTLNPSEKASLAEHYARMFAPTTAEITETEIEISPLRQEWNKISSANLAPLEKLAKITMAAEEKSLMRNFGTRVLKGFLAEEQNPAVKYYFGNGIRLTGDFWDSVREKLLDPPAPGAEESPRRNPTNGIAP